MEKIKLLLYCVKAKPLLYKGITAYTRSVEYVLDKEQYLFGKIETLNGKIVAECDFECEEIKTYYNNQIYKGCRVHTIKTYNISKLLELSCLNQKQLDDYLGENNGFAIHIKNLHIFDKPRELNKYSKRIGNDFQVLGNAPQNMMYCYGNNTGDKYILISIRPEWLCKILNGEKTIEIRKKVLKVINKKTLQNGEDCL